MHNLSGINAVNVYITQLLIIKKEETNGEFPITPGSGAFIIAIVNMIGCICALLPMRLIGRKPILMLGYGGLSVSLFVIGLAYLKEWNLLMFITVSVYTFIFQITVGGCTWFYTAETTLDKSMGVCIFVQFLWLIIIVGTFEFIISSPLGTHGSFWVFAAIMFFGFLFTALAVKETKGKTDL